MTRLKTRTRTTHTLYVGENEDVELEVDHEPNDPSDVLVRRTADGGWVVGYLSHDDDCSNPIDDCDGMGKILDGRRFSSTSVEYEEAVRERDPLTQFLDVYSHSGDAWRVQGSGRYFPDERWDVSHGAGVWVPDKECRIHILMMSALEYANPEHFALWRERVEAWKAAPRAQRGEYPSRTSSLLDFTSRYHSEPTGRKNERGYDVNRYWTTYGWRLGNRSRGGFKTVERAIDAGLQAFDAWRAARRKKKAKYRRYRFDQAKYDQLCRQEAYRCATSCVDEYNKRLSGDCWGVCVERFDEEGSPISDGQDACWGYVGEEYAQEELESLVAAYAAEGS